ncbi:MAG TPA: peroxiredoxin [Candidatus Marinimicrobia bacterium]|nr:peroxiredoxin [Candidatus Neomarinimicrobiota bacterium]
MRDSYRGFEKQKIVVFGISYDSVESQRKFRDKYSLPFSLLSDRKHTVGKAYGVDKKIYSARKTFVIDEAGKIIKIYDKVSVTTHGEDVLEFFSSLEIPKE